MTRATCSATVAAVAAVWAGYAALVTNCQAQEEASSRIVSVSMFKNGLALVERELNVRGPGEFRIADIPRPVHGTLWFMGDPNVTARVAMEDVEVEPRAGEVDIQRDLSGRRVAVYLRDVQAPISGIVRKFADPEPAGNANSIRASRGVPSASKYLVLETETGESFIDRSAIVHMSIEGSTKKVKRRRAVLIVKVPDGGRARPTIRLRYLSMGVSWAPSYLVELTDDKRLRIRQKAVVRNELTDLKNVELKLISGFPHIRFRHVTSPLNTTWNQFFQQINQRAQQQSDFASNLLSQQLAMPASNSPLPVDLKAAAAGEGVDLHYESIGKQTLDRGDSLAFPVTTGAAEYNRIVEWIVPDTRDANGRQINQYQRNQDPDKYQDDPWDALQFRNPLTMPMTTGPATIMSGGQFNGQTASYWVSRSELTTLRVTKSLSIRTLASENERQGNRDIVYIGGNDYQRVPVEGRLIISNHRNELVDMVVRRRFSGDLTKADGEPKLTLREEGVYSVNRRNELTWRLKLKPGEQRELKYNYTVLVDR